MSQPVLKICGVTKESEVEDLCRLGVDFFGLLVEAPSPLVLTEQRAKQLARCQQHQSQQQTTRATLVTDVRQAEELELLITILGVRAIQLGVRVSPSVVRALRDCYPEDDLTIIQEIPYRGGRFLKENQVAEFLDAGANFILLDKLEKTDRLRHDEGPIASSDLVEFRDRHPGVPLLIAAGVTSKNASSLLASSGAAGIDVCSSVRRDGAVCPTLVSKLMQQMAKELM